MQLHPAQLTADLHQLRCHADLPQVQLLHRQLFNILHHAAHIRRHIVKVEIVPAVLQVKQMRITRLVQRKGQLFRAHRADVHPLRLQQIIVRHAVQQPGKRNLPERKLIHKGFRVPDKLRLKALSVLRRAGIPRVLTRQCDGVHAPQPALRMPAVAPVGQQQPFRAVFRGQFAAGTNVEGGHIHASRQGTVRVHGGAYVVTHSRVAVRDAVRAHPLGLDQLIAPFQCDRILRHHAVAPGIIIDHICPEHDLLPIMLPDVVVQPVQPLHERNVLPLFPAVFLALISSQAVRFVQPDIHVPAGKIRQQGIVQTGHEVKALRQEKIQRGRHLVLRAVQTQVTEGRLPEPGIHMSEGVLVGHQVDKALPAVPVQLQNILRRQAVKVRGFLRIRGIFEAVPLHIKLKLVVFESRQQVDHPPDRFRPRLFSPADVDHVSPSGQGGLILHAQARHPAVKAAQQLLQRSHGAEQSLLAGAFQRRAVFADGNPVLLVFQHRVVNRPDFRNSAVPHQAEESGQFAVLLPHREFIFSSRENHAFRFRKQNHGSSSLFTLPAV